MSENLPTFLKGLRKGHKGGFQRFAKYIMMMAYLVVDWPIWKICDREIGSFSPSFRGENKHIWNPSPSIVDDLEDDFPLPCMYSERFHVNLPRYDHYFTSRPNRISFPHLTPPAGHGAHRPRYCWTCPGPTAAALKIMAFQKKVRCFNVPHKTWDSKYRIQKQTTNQNHHFYTSAFFGEIMWNMYGFGFVLLPNIMANFSKVRNGLGCSMPLGP